jgi:hypothetical protein
MVTAVVLLAQVPPPAASVNVAVVPTHRPVLPAIADIGLTVIILVDTHAPPREYVIVAVPPDSPYISPLPSAVATVVLLLVHAPPNVVSVKVTVAPTHTLGRPEIAPGDGLTVTVNVEVHPPKVYVTVAVPVDTPYTVPVPLTVAIPPLAGLQVPPGLPPSDNPVVEPAQTTAVPAIAPGAAVTVITLVTVQPEPNEYVIVTMPGFTPVTTPPSTVATDVDDEVHDPPGGVSVSVAVAPAQTELTPMIGPGDGLTVTTVVPVQPLVDV